MSSNQVQQAFCWAMDLQKGVHSKRHGKKAILHIDQQFLFKQILQAKFAISGSQNLNRHLWSEFQALSKSNLAISSSMPNIPSAQCTLALAFILINLLS
jgi:hypothetical protein